MQILGKIFVGDLIIGDLINFLANFNEGGKTGLEGAKNIDPKINVRISASNAQ